MANITNKCSEDLFQVSQDSQVRRSQRILERHLNTPIQQLSNTEHISLRNLASNRTSETNCCEVLSQKLNNAGERISNTSLERRSQTPDFTTLIEISQKRCKAFAEAENFLCFDVLKEQDLMLDIPLDLRKNDTKEEIFNIESLKNAKPTQSKQLLPENTNSKKDTKHEVTQIGLDQMKKNNEKGISIVGKNKRSRKLAGASKIKRTESQTVFNITETKSKIPTKKVKQPSCQRHALNITKETLLPKTLPKTTVKRNRLEPSRPNLQAPSKKLKTNPIQTLTPASCEYIPPKIVRYYNSCPALPESSVFPYENSPMHQSLLPSIYPSHFTQQIVMASSAAPMPKILEHEKPDLPISLLTPDNSEIIVIESSNEMEVENLPSISTTSPTSLLNFFKIDEINDILDMEKTAYVLTELQVRALAYVLKIDENELYTQLDEIVEMDQNILKNIINGENYDKYLNQSHFP